MRDRRAGMRASRNVADSSEDAVSSLTFSRDVSDVIR